MDLHSARGDADELDQRRYVTLKTLLDYADKRRSAAPDSTPFSLSWEEEDGRNDPRQRFALYRLCECEECGGRGREHYRPGESFPARDSKLGATERRCTACRGEGRALQLLATCESPEAAGVALVTLAREREWAECPLGLLDRQGEKGQKWLVLPWLPSPRNVSDAGRTLRGARK